jgi:hypothetical protein
MNPDDFQGKQITCPICNEEIVTLLVNVAGKPFHHCQYGGTFNYNNPTGLERIEKALAEASRKRAAGKPPETVPPPPEPAPPPPAAEPEKPIDEGAQIVDM